jgi:hypothetical protein
MKYVTRKIAYLATGVMLWAYAPAKATVYFSDNFQSGLGQWQPGSGGVIVSALPTYLDALTFDDVHSGGDIFSIASVPAGSYLTFDYEGIGGFIGAGGVWLAGESGYPGIEEALTYDSTWRQYTVLVPDAGTLMAEIWNGSAGTPYSAEFANIVDSSSPPNGVSDGGATCLLLGGALLGLSWMSRKKRS